LVVPLLVTAIATLHWCWLVAGVVTFVLSLAISMGGAGLWPGLAEMLGGTRESR